LKKDLFKNIVAAPPFQMWQQGMGVGIFIIKHYRIFHCSQSEPRVGPTRREALDTTTAARKAERRRVIRWMKWEPMNLTAKVRGGGHKKK